MQAGDIVVDFDGERVRSASHFTRLVQESVPDRQVAAIVIRGTAKQTLQLVPEGTNRFDRLLSNNSRRQLQGLERQVPRNFNFNFDPDTLRRSLPALGGNLGVTVSPLNDQLASYFGVKQGVLVNAVTSDSPAAQAGLKAGDRIVKLAGKDVRNVYDYTYALGEMKAGQEYDVEVMRGNERLKLKLTPAARR